MTTRDALLRDLRHDADRVAALLGELDTPRLAQGAYEQGWTVRDLIAHLAAIEWTYPRLLDLAKHAAGTGAAADGSAAAGGAAVDTAADGGSAVDMDAYNARQVAKRRDAAPAELIDEFRRNREATISAVAGVDGALLAQPIRSYGGAEGTLLEVLRAVTIDHLRQHLADIEAAI